MAGGGDVHTWCVLTNTPMPLLAKSTFLNCQTLQRYHFYNCRLKAQESDSPDGLRDPETDGFTFPGPKRTIWSTSAFRGQSLGRLAVTAQQTRRVTPSSQFAQNCRLLKTESPKA